MGMSVKDMDFLRHPATHFAAVLHQSLNRFHIIFGLVIAQEAPNHCDKAVPRFIFLPTELLGEFCALQDLLHLWSNEDASFDLCLRQLREEVSKVIEGCKLLTKNCNKSVS
ncbi:uncharacterized protein LOC143224105 [Tachypleus tridentatus]|uniref:uncharacterized protein LOC143224105 n=1 Tax=Tachypleus tridentatus TaxID=6853 RepID=UPI003FD18FE4